MTQRAACMACGRPFPLDRLLCANCRQPIQKRDRWHHDEFSRAVHLDCDQPTGYPPVKIETK